MRVRHFVILGAFGLASGLSACGDGGGGGGGDDEEPVTETGKDDKGGDGDAEPAPSDGTEGPGETTGDGTGVAGERTAAECETLWQQVVAASPAGLVKEYETTYSQSSAGGQDFAMKSTSREEIVEATDAAITTEYTSRQLEPMETEATVTPGATHKPQFIEACLKPVGATQAPAGDFSVEILERSVKSVTVRAGTFSCDFLKYRVTGTSAGEPYESLYESSTSKVKPFVQVLSESTSQQGAPGTEDGVRTTVSRTELVALSVP